MEAQKNLSRSPAEQADRPVPIASAQTWRGEERRSAPARNLAGALRNIVARGRGHHREAMLRDRMIYAAEKARELGHYPRRFEVDTETSAITHCSGCGAIIAVDISERPYLFGAGLATECEYKIAASCSCQTCRSLRMPRVVGKGW